jgi:hypothetical protein
MKDRKQKGIAFWAGFRSSFDVVGASSLAAAERLYPRQPAGTAASDVARFIVGLGAARAKVLDTAGEREAAKQEGEATRKPRLSASTARS